jgi:hypothetical protein
LPAYAPSAVPATRLHETEADDLTIADALGQKSLGVARRGSERAALPERAQKRDRRMRSDDGEEDGPKSACFHAAQKYPPERRRQVNCLILIAPRGGLPFSINAIN